MPSNKDNIFAWVVLSDVVDDCVYLSTWVCCCDAGSKGERGMWFASTSALYMETVGHNVVLLCSLLGLEGCRREGFRQKVRWW